MEKILFESALVLNDSLKYEVISPTQRTLAQNQEKNQVIDRTAFESAMQESGDILMETLELIQVQHVSMIDDLVKAYEEKDFTKLKNILHTIRGMLSNIYADRSIARLSELELKIDLLSDIQVKSLLDEISREILELNQEIIKLLRKSSAA
ncbi:MAG: hypothetical protein AB8G05_26315 [Oligoflexales bacterium]